MNATAMIDAMTRREGSDRGLEADVDKSDNAFGQWTDSGRG